MFNKNLLLNTLFNLLFNHNTNSNTVILSKTLNLMDHKILFVNN